MQHKPIIYLILLFFLAFSSCKGDGIFYTLRDETIIINDKFSDDVDIRDIFAVSGEVFAVGKRLWHLSSTDNWVAVSYPENIEEMDSSVTSAAAYLGNVYVSFYSSLANQSYIYYYNIGDNSWTNALESSLPNGGDNYFLFSNASDGNNLYVNQVGHGETFSDRDTSLFHVSSPTFSLDAVIATLTAPVQSMSWDGTNYWLVANTPLDADNFSEGVLMSTNGNLDSFDGINLTGAYNTVSVITLTSGHLIVTGMVEGEINYSKDYGSSWNTLDTENNNYIINAFVDLGSYNNNSDNIFLAGIMNLSSKSSRFQGYRSILYSEDGSTLTFTDNIADQVSYDSSNLDSSSIMDFLFISGTGVLYTATGNGIWKLESPGGEWGQE